MNQFKKLPSLVQIAMAELLAVMFLAAPIIRCYENIHFSLFDYRSLPLEGVDYVLIGIGVLAFLWVLATIVRPGIHHTRYIPLFHGDGAVMFNSGMRSEYLFSSTHPSYVFIDLLSVVMYWGIRSMWVDAWPERIYQGNILLILAAVIPILRLFAWYGLCLRPGADAETQFELRSSWKPVAVLYGFFLLPVGLLLVGVWLSMDYQQKSREQGLTLVDPSNWQGQQTFDALRDENYFKETKQLATSIIRLRVIQKTAAAMICSNENNMSNASGYRVSVLGSLDSQNDVLVVSLGIADRDDIQSMVRRAKDNSGQFFEAMGRLIPMPDSEKIPFWKKYCNLENIVPRPRWVLEEEWIIK